MLYKGSTHILYIADIHTITFQIITELSKKKEEKSFDFSSVVAGVGFEPHDLRVMSPTSYRLLYPAILDCKYTDIF